VTESDTKLLMGDVRKLFPGAEKYWSAEEWSVLFEVVRRFDGDYEQALAVVRAHRADTDKRTPSIPTLKRRLRECEARPASGLVASAPSAAYSLEPTGFLRTVAILSKTNPDDPKVKLARTACARCPEFAATMRKAGMEVDT
jgi:hypothetical protein